MAELNTHPIDVPEKTFEAGSKNRRILIVDDNEAVHEAFRKILNPAAGSSELDRFETELFGHATPAGKAAEFELDFAFQGAEALEMIRQERQANRPYALAFVDVRMPPGWDGVETLFHIFQEDPAIQAVICSAFSDYSWEQITERLGQTDRLLILKKPFDNIEARQMAYALTDKWNLRRDAGQRMEALDASQKKYRELAAENERLYREAQQMNQMKDEFLATLSHEMRTPLTSILGWSQLLLRQLVGPEAVPRAVETIERNARAQAQLVEDLLDVSRIITGKFHLNLETVNLAAVTNAAIESLKPAIMAKQIEFTVKTSDGLPSIVGDPSRLQQVAWNILSNAVRHTPVRGRIDVSIEARDERVSITFKDNGSGIDPAHLSRLFERFYQVDTSTTRPHGGLGLGLAIVRHVVELHGGTVRIESEGPKKGTTVIVELPVRKNLKSDSTGPTKAGAETAAAPARRLDGISILVVDDEFDTRDFLTHLLTTAGARVTAVASVEAALKDFDRLSPNLLISDIRMPQVDGYSLIQELRRRGRNIPAVALTAFAGNDDRLHALAEGFQRHMSKPIDPERLLSTVAELLGAG